MTTIESKQIAYTGKNPFSGERGLDFKTRSMVGFGTRLLNTWFSTCRIEIHGQKIHERYVLGEEKAVGATWHRGAIFLVWFFRNTHPMIMFSRSKDGEMLSEFARRLGVIPIRGSSNHGGQAALDGMKMFLRRPGRQKAATVLDGPRGPRYVAKKGMIVLARDTGAPFLPIMVSARPALTLKHTWDKTMIPLPFSRVVVTYRDPWRIPKELDGEGLEEFRREVEDTLNEMRRAADRYTGYREK